MKYIQNGKLISWPTGTALRVAKELRAIPRDYRDKTLGAQVNFAEQLLATIKGIINSGDAGDRR